MSRPKQFIVLLTIKSSPFQSSRHILTAMYIFMMALTIVISKASGAFIHVIINNKINLRPQLTLLIYLLIIIMPRN